MITRLATITLMAFQCFGFCFGQDSTGSARCPAFGDPFTSVREIMRGAPYDSVKQHFSPEAFVISGRRQESITSTLNGKDRSAILNEDSTRRIIWMDVKGNDAGDALYVVLKTVGAHEDQPHLHSLVLYKKPTGGWQICLWHVGS